MDRRAEILRGVFPHAPRDVRVRKDIHARYNTLRIFRNRVFHFEPIWNRPDLTGQHDHMTEAIAWISPTLAELVARCDRFPDVLASGRTPARTVLAAQLANA